jgi:hypothetical protein
MNKQDLIGTYEILDPKGNILKKLKIPIIRKADPTNNAYPRIPLLPITHTIEGNKLLQTNDIFDQTTCFIRAESIDSNIRFHDTKIFLDPTSHSNFVLKNTKQVREIIDNVVIYQVHPTEPTCKHNTKDLLLLKDLIATTTKIDTLLSPK